MKSLKFLEVEIKLLSPTIIPSKMTRNGYIRPLDYIPGSTLRGALLTALYRLGYVDDETIKQEATEPSVLSTPAYPVKTLEESVTNKVLLYRTLPATPTTFRCKICGKTVFSLSIWDPSSEEPHLMVECPRHGPMKSLYALPVYKHGDNIRIYRPRIIHATSVSIHKELGVAMKGMLFSYEAIAEGTRFWARLAMPDYIAKKLPDRLNVSIGRGSSRGFGSSSVKIKHCEDLAGHETTSGVFISLSPLIPLSRFSYGGCEVKISKVLGRSMKTLSGWDMLLGRHRPLIELVKPGAVVKAEINCRDFENTKTFIKLLSYGGVPIKLDETWLTGFNVLIPVNEYVKFFGGSLE